MMDLGLGAPRRVDVLNLSRFQDAPRTLYFYARGNMAEGLAAGRFRFLARLIRDARADGWEVALIEDRGAWRQLIGTRPHLHISLTDKPVYGHGVFHAVPSYLRGYWFFDEVATRNNSSHRLRPFDPRPLSQSYADKVFAQVRAQFVEANFSKFEQAPRGATIEDGALVFFAQALRTPKLYPDFVSAEDMIQSAILEKGDRALYIKPHPNQSAEDRAVLEGYADPAKRVFITDASVHDLCAAASVVLTLTSACGFEAFLHETPVILGGQTDFWQNAVTLTRPDRLEDALEVARATEWPHAKFVMWYLKHNCIDESPGSYARVKARLARKGFAIGEDPGFFAGTTGPTI